MVGRLIVRIVEHEASERCLSRRNLEHRKNRGCAKNISDRLVPYDVYDDSNEIITEGDIRTEEGVLIREVEDCLEQYKLRPFYRGLKKIIKYLLDTRREFIKNLSLD